MRSPHPEAARPRILFLQSKIDTHGGDYAVAAWMLEALKVPYEVTVLTWQTLDLTAINRVFGTCLAQEQFRWRFPSRSARFLIQLIPDRWDTQKTGWLMRVCKRIQSGYDVLITANSEIDFGRDGVQYLHFPYLGVKYRALLQYRHRSGWRAFPAVMRRLYQPWMMIAGFSFDRIRSNFTLANSRFTAEEFRTYYGKTATVLYPPAAVPASENCWTKRSDDFICLGRLEPVKNHARMVAIIRRVRERYPRVRLHIVGTRSHKASGAKYYRTLIDLVAAHADWVELHEDLPREELRALLSRVRYGLHLLPGEPFGMAVAEMLRAGVVPFVHRSGGQVEIVQEPELIFENDDEAVARICTFLDQAALQSRIHALLEGRRSLFSPEQFCENLVDLVEQFRMVCKVPEAQSLERDGPAAKGTSPRQP